MGEASRGFPFQPWMKILVGSTASKLDSDRLCGSSSRKTWYSIGFSLRPAAHKQKKTHKKRVSRQFSSISVVRPRTWSTRGRRCRWRCPASRPRVRPAEPKRGRPTLAWRWRFNNRKAIRFRLFIVTRPVCVVVLVVRATRGASIILWRSPS